MLTPTGGAERCACDRADDGAAGAGRAVPAALSDAAVVEPGVDAVPVDAAAAVVAVDSEASGAATVVVGGGPGRDPH